MSLGIPNACPLIITRALREYREKHHEAGGFVMAVLRNDLLDAISRADMGNTHDIHHIMAWCSEHLPTECWGSPEAVKAWLDKHGPGGSCHCYDRLPAPVDTPA